MSTPSNAAPNANRPGLIVVFIVAAVLGTALAYGGQSLQSLIHRIW
jgi:hypothetical protein